MTAKSRSHEQRDAVIYGATLRALRKERSLSEYRLGRALRPESVRAGQQRVRRLQAKRASDVPRAEAEKIATALGVEVSDLARPPEQVSLAFEDASEVVRRALEGQFHLPAFVAAQARQLRKLAEQNATPEEVQASVDRFKATLAAIQAALSASAANLRRLQVNVEDSINRADPDVQAALNALDARIVEEGR